VGGRRRGFIAVAPVPLALSSPLTVISFLICNGWCTSACLLFWANFCIAWRMSAPATAFHLYSFPFSSRIRLDSAFLYAPLHLLPYILFARLFISISSWVSATVTANNMRGGGRYNVPAARDAVWLVAVSNAGPFTAGAVAHGIFMRALRADAANGGIIIDMYGDMRLALLAGGWCCCAGNSACILTPLAFAGGGGGGNSASLQHAGGRLLANGAVISRWCRCVCFRGAAGV